MHLGANFGAKFSVHGASTLSMMTFSIMTFNIMTFNIMTFSIMIFRIAINKNRHSIMAGYCYAECHLS